MALAKSNTIPTVTAVQHLYEENYIVTFVSHSLHFPERPSFIT